ncbi:MAG: cyanophycin synthetase, partial [Pseudomonadota bacterium]
APLALPGGGAALLIDESYNANPASMRAALETFAAADPPAPGGRRVAFLTDMLELGAAGPAMHAALAEAPGMAAIDLVCLAGPLTRSLRDALDPARRGPWFEDAEALAEAAPGVLQAGDLVMVKGSNGSRAGLIARRLRALAAGAPETPPG